VGGVHVSWYAYGTCLLAWLEAHWTFKVATPSDHDHNNNNSNSNSSSSSSNANNNNKEKTRLPLDASRFFPVQLKGFVSSSTSNNNNNNNNNNTSNANNNNNTNNNTDTENKNKKKKTNDVVDDDIVVSPPKKKRKVAASARQKRPKYRVVRSWYANAFADEPDVYVHHYIVPGMGFLDALTHTQTPHTHTYNIAAAKPSSAIAFKKL